MARPKRRKTFTFLLSGAIEFLWSFDESDVVAEFLPDGNKVDDLIKKIEDTVFKTLGLRIAVFVDEEFAQLVSPKKPNQRSPKSELLKRLNRAKTKKSSRKR